MRKEFDEIKNVYKRYYNLKEVKKEKKDCLTLGSFVNHSSEITVSLMSELSKEATKKFNENILVFKTKTTETVTFHFKIENSVVCFALVFGEDEVGTGYKCFNNDIISYVFMPKRDKDREEKMFQLIKDDVDIRMLIATGIINKQN